jgi:hypothetical protein
VWTTQPFTVQNGDQVKLRVTSSANYLTGRAATLDIGGLKAPFRVVTKFNPNAASLVPSSTPPVVKNLEWASDELTEQFEFQLGKQIVIITNNLRTTESVRLGSDDFLKRAVYGNGMSGELSIWEGTTRSAGMYPITVKSHLNSQYVKVAAITGIALGNFYAEKGFAPGASNGGLLTINSPLEIPELGVGLFAYNANDNGIPDHGTLNGAAILSELTGSSGAVAAMGSTAKTSVSVMPEWAVAGAVAASWSKA